MHIHIGIHISMYVIYCYWLVRSNVTTGTWIQAEVNWRAPSDGSYPFYDLVLTPYYDRASR